MPRPKKSTPVTYYAITFDMIGGPYEFNSNNTFDPNFELFPESGYKYVFTDDSILTTAVARMVRECGELFEKSERLEPNKLLEFDEFEEPDKLRELDKWSNDEEIIKNGVANLKKFVKDYPNGFPGGYGGKFKTWANSEGKLSMEDDPDFKYKSCGNGSGMRVSSVGWAFNTLEQTLHMAKLTAMPSHSDIEGIKGAQAIAAAIYLARAGVDKKDIKLYLETKFDYNLDKTLEEYRKYNHDELKIWQSEVCPTTVPMAIRAFLEGENFEDCGRKAVTIGGDSDTIGAMAASMAGAYYGMPKWLEEECDKRLDDTLRNEAKAFQEYVDSRNTEPDMGEIETALARARLEKYVLDEFKAGHRVIPKDDPKFLELLAETEATRLLYDEVNKACQKKDEIREQALTGSKDAFVKQLKELVKANSDFVGAYSKIVDCPVEMVKTIDYDKNKREPGVPSSLPQEVPKIRHLAIPNKIVTTGSIDLILQESEIKKAKECLELKDRVKEVMAQQSGRASTDDTQIRTEKFYKAAIYKMTGENGEIGRYFEFDKMPELLKNALDDLWYMNNSTDVYDPVSVSAGIVRELKELSDELIGTATAKNSETVVGQVAFLNRLAEAVEGWYEAPEDLRVFAPMDVIVNKAEELDAYTKQQQAEADAKYEKYTIVGQTTKRYYKEITNDLLGNESLGACFDLNKLPAELKKAMECWQQEKSKEALNALEKLSEKLTEKMLDDDSMELMRQVTLVNRLMTAVDNVVNAPEDPDIDIHDTLYKHLNDRAEEISRAMEKIEDKDSKEYALAKRAQEGMRNIQKAVSDDFNGNRNDKALNALKKGDDYAAVFMYQNMQKFIAIAKLNPNEEPNAEKREAVKDVKAYLKNFESQDLSISLEQIKKDKTFMLFEKDLNIFKLEKNMRDSVGMLAGYREVKPSVVSEDCREIDNFKKMFTASDNENKKYSLKEYKAGIRELDAITKRNSDNLNMLKDCGEIMEALLNHVAANDDKKLSISNALADDQLISKAVRDITKTGILAARKLDKATKSETKQTKQTTEISAK